LAGDPAILERSGQLFSSRELGREYRFTDTDGRRPDWGASKIDFSKHPEQLLQLLRTGSEIQLRWLNELRRKTKHFLTQLPDDCDNTPPTVTDAATFNYRGERVIRIERVYGPVYQSLVLALKLETIEANGAPEPLYARLESVIKRAHNTSVDKDDLGSFDRTFDPAFDPKDPAVGMVQFDDVTDGYVINRGLEIAGITAAAN